VHLLIRNAHAVFVQVERIGILHDELARTHYAETRPDLVAEFRLHLVEVDRQLLVAAQFAAGDVGDDLLVRRPEAVFAVAAIVHAQQQGAVFVPASRFLPEFGRLHGGHQQFERPGAVHLLAYHPLDLAQHAQAEWHPGEQT